MYGNQGGKAAGYGGGGGMNWEIVTDMYTLMYIKWMTNKNLLYKKINKIKFKNKKKLYGFSMYLLPDNSMMPKAYPLVLFRYAPSLGQITVTLGTLKKILWGTYHAQ